MSLDLSPQTPTAVEEARRQMEICNACRYCEGFCSVFPAMTRQKAFADGDLTQMANLCHNCRGCYYACQYTEPHEFALNIPAALGAVRQESWERLVSPAPVARAFQTHGVAIAAALVAAVAAIIWVMATFAPTAGDGFYAHMAHATMVAVFVPAFVAPLAIIALAIRAYWREVGGGSVRLRHLWAAALDAGRLKNLSGGQGQGCNFEQGDRPSDRRRLWHQAVMWGFLMCFAATSSATVMHYGFGLEAPYPFFSIPKLLGVPGGIAMVVGAGGLVHLKLRADPALGVPRVWGGEMAFVLLLGFVAATGLGLYAVTGTVAVRPLLAVHLASVLVLFVLMPYSKMVHGFFRFTALVAEAERADRTKIA